MVGGAGPLEPGTVAHALEAVLDLAALSGGLAFEEWVARAGASPSWLRRMRDLSAPPACVEAFRRFGQAGGQVYGLAEGWCGDCAQVVPALARVCQQAGVSLRLFRRDADPGLREAHLTGGRAKIPLVVAVQPDPVRPGKLQEVGRFVERPALANARLREGDPTAYSGPQVTQALWGELVDLVDGRGEPWEVASPGGPIRAHLHLPRGVRPRACVVTAHGASYDQSHPLSRHFCQRLAQRGVAAVRFDFRFRTQSVPPSPDASAEAEQLQAVARAAMERLQLPPQALVLAGKSIGAVAAWRAAHELPVAAVVAFGPALHPPNRPGPGAEQLLAGLATPVLWFAARRDPYAEPSRVEQAFRSLPPGGQLVWLEDDHSLAASLQAVLDMAVSWVLQRT